MTAAFYKPEGNTLYYTTGSKLIRVELDSQKSTSFGGTRTYVSESKLNSRIEF